MPVVACSRVATQSGKVFVGGVFGTIGGQQELSRCGGFRDRCRRCLESQPQ
jgi:hypothetical protein